MSKYIYTSRKRQSDPSLVRIIFVIVVVLIVAYGGLQIWMGLGGDGSGGGNVEASSVVATPPLDDARSLMEQGDLSGAREMLERNPRSGLMAEALLARIDAEKGQAVAAIERLNKALETHGSSPDHAEASVIYAKLLEETGKTADAVTVYSRLRDEAPARFRSAALSGLGREAERGNDLVKARDYFRDAMRDAPRDDPFWEEAVAGFGRTNVALIFSRQETPESKTYVVQSGDSLTNIGIKLNTTQGLLTRANGLEEDSILRIDQRLKYTPKDFRIVVERSTCRLYLFDKDGLFKMYRTGLGKPGYETSLGRYTIGSKQKDPVWFKPGAEPVAAGDPENELGTRWMPLVPAEEGLPTDLGIHGTIDPDTIGTYASRGCPRMYTEEVEELYDLVVRSTPVEIVEKLDWDSIGVV